MSFFSARIGALTLAPVTLTSAPFAQGEEWRLERSGSDLLLYFENQSPVRLHEPRWSTGVDGRHLVSRDKAGATVTLIVGHGVCRSGQEGTIATLVINNRRMLGCLLITGDRPYPGGRNRAKPFE